MSSFAGVNSLLPGRNPVGGPLPSNYAGIPATGSSSGANPVLPPTNLPAGAPASNPYAPGSAVPTFGANTGGGYTSTNLAGGGSSTGKPGSSPSNILAGMSPADIKRLHDELGNTFGNGVAAALMNFLTSGAGFNQDAVNNIFAALQPGIERGTESLAEQFSTSGNRFGSGAQIGIADYLSQVNLNEGEIESQMYQHSVDNALSTLMGLTKGTETTLANSPSTMDSLTSALPMISGAAGGASAAGVGGTAGTILDIIASMCWVASELYGGWFAPETVAIRGWLLRTWYMAPFVALYRRYGKRWAGFIRSHSIARKVTRNLFDVFLRMAK